MLGDLFSIAVVSIPIALGFLITLFLLRPWINIAKKFGLTGKDMNKYNSTQVAEAGGIAVIIGICFGLLIFIFIKTFYLAADSNIIFIFSLITAVLLIGFIGFVDDILGWKVGLKQKHKFL